jgi:sugar (pentulose or hexulose) kinase
MIVLEKTLSKVYSEIDLVTTPDGSLVAMAHSNNCTSDLDAWLSLFSQSFELVGTKITTSELYAKLLPEALKGDADCGGLLSYGYISGEHVTGFEEGRPLFVRLPNSNFTLANFIRTHLFASLGAMRTGLNILFEQESVRVDEIRGHGGFFKTEDVGQKIMAAVTNTPVNIMETAGEGGAWGIALLSSYMLNKDGDESLSDFLNKRVFNNSKGFTIDPNPTDVEGYNKFFELYHNGLKVERAAVEALKA